MVALDDGEVDGLAQLGRQLDQERPRQRREIGADRGGEAQDGRPEPHPPHRRGGNQELFGFQRRDNTLHRRAREPDTLRDLAEAQAQRLVLERAQNRRSAGNDLHLIFIIGRPDGRHHRGSFRNSPGGETSASYRSGQRELAD
jgi:hypothetical protein